MGQGPDALQKRRIFNALQEMSPGPQSNVRKTVKRKTGGYQDVLTESPFLRSLHEKEIEKTQEPQ